jgi:hypothetical protein
LDRREEKRTEERKYKLRYRIDVGSFSADEVDDWSGLTDEIFLCSYLGEGDDSGSYLWCGYSGITLKPMLWDRQFHCLLTLVKKLGETAPKNACHEKKILQRFFEEFRLLILETNRRNHE